MLSHSRLLRSLRVVCAVALFVAAMQTPLRAEEPAGAPSFAPGTTNSVIGIGTLPRDLSPWGMFRNADIVVQIVMVGLVVASLASWTVFAAKTVEIVGQSRRLRAARTAIGDAETFGAARQAVPATSDVPAALIAAVHEEFVHADGLPADGVRERIMLASSQVIGAAVEQLKHGTGMLATTGAIAPFVGLFGTVWGIMNSFIGISRVQTTNLAVVAPGIAEALLATAIGLAVAIPAVVLYNIVTRSIVGYRTALEDLAVHLLRLAGRDLDRGLHLEARERRSTERMGFK